MTVSKDDRLKRLEEHIQDTILEDICFEIPKKFLDTDVKKAIIEKTSEQIYLLEYFTSGEIKLNGRPVDANLKPLGDPGYRYVYLDGEVFRSKEITNNIGTVIGYELPMGTIWTKCVGADKLNDIEMHAMVNIESRDLYYKTWKNFEKNGASYGEYKKGERVLELMKKEQKRSSQ